MEGGTGHLGRAVSALKTARAGGAKRKACCHPSRGSAWSHCLHTPDRSPRPLPPITYQVISGEASRSASQRSDAPCAKKKKCAKRTHLPPWPYQKRGFRPFSMASFGFALAVSAVIEPIPPLLQTPYPNPHTLGAFVPSCLCAFPFVASCLLPSAPPGRKPSDYSSVFSTTFKAGTSLGRSGSSGGRSFRELRPNASRNLFVVP